MSAQEKPTSVAEGDGDQPPPLRSLWHNADFLRLWFGEAASLAGTQVTALAVPLAAVLMFQAGPEQVGLLRFLQLLPFLLFALLLGVWVDRVRRRPVMVLSNLARALLIGTVPVLAATGHLQLEILYIVAFTVGVGAVLFDLCWLSYVPTVVPDRRNLMEANGKLSVTSAAADIGGPGFAGLLVQLLTAPVALIVDAVSYLVSMVSLMMIKTTEPVPERKPDRGVRRELWAGLKWVAGNPYLRTVAFTGGAYNFLLTFIEAVFLVYAVRTLGLNVGTLGLILSVGAVGGLLGALIANRATRLLSIGRAFLLAAVLGFVAPVLIPLAGGPRGLTVVVLAAAFFISFLGVGIANVIGLSLRQSITPRTMLGRMNAAMRTLMYGLGALGAVVGGALAAVIGMREALWVGALGFTLALIPLLLSPVPRLRAIPAPEPEPV